MNFRGEIHGWREYWPPAALKHRHEEIGDRAYQQGYRMRAYSDEDYTLPHFEDVLKRREPPTPNPLPRDWKVLVGVDLAGTKRPGNAIFAGALDPHFFRHPLEVSIIKGSSPDVARAIDVVAQRWKPVAIMIENNAYQGALEDWIKEAKGAYPWWTTLVPFTTGRQKADEKLGIPALDVEFANGAWKMPEHLNPRLNGHDLSCPCAPCLWVREVLNYPHGATSDALMASYFFRECCRRWEMDARMGGDEYAEPTFRSGYFPIPVDEIE